MNEPDIRWKQRFENLDKGLQRLLKTQKAFSKTDEPDVVRIALIGAFMFTFELSWKTLKDFLNYEGVQVTYPREVIKQAFQNGLLEDGELWIHMLEARNIMSHAYDEAVAIEVSKSILEHYLPAFKKLHQSLKTRLEN